MKRNFLFHQQKLPRFDAIFRAQLVIVHAGRHLSAGLIQAVPGSGVVSGIQFAVNQS